MHSFRRTVSFIALHEITPSLGLMAGCFHWNGVGVNFDSVTVKLSYVKANIPRRNEDETPKDLRLGGAVIR